jgi:hypothetical protein
MPTCLASHGSFSSLSYEDLALLRENMLKLVEKEGMIGLKKFAAMHKRESRINPRTCFIMGSTQILPFIIIGSTSSTSILTF